MNHLEKIIGRSVKIDAIAKQNMIGQVHRFGDFAHSMKSLSEHRGEVIRAVKFGVDEETKKVLDLFYRKNGKVKITSKVGEEKHFEKFTEFMGGKMGEKSVLDVGCGMPKPEVMRRWKNYVGVDMFENEFSGISQFKGGLIGAEATYLPFRNRSFDYAIAYWVIPILGMNAYFGINELVRVSKEGIAFTVTHEDSIYAWMEQEKDDREFLGYAPREMHIVEFDYCKGIFRGLRDDSLSTESVSIYFNEKKIKEFLESLGFAEVKIFTSPYKITELGKTDRVVNGTMEIIAMKRN